MHELAVAQGIVDKVCEVAAGRTVLKITIEIGAASCVSPHALAFCFDLVAEDSAAAGARLEILEAPGETLNVKSLELEEAA